MNDILEVTFKIVLCVILSSFIGLEREVRNKIAGLRTHILVGLGSALVVLTSIYIFDVYREITFVDPTRMITGVVTGIGFLCAGTIIQAGDTVRGLTTAATLWIVSCVGISVGAGHYSAAIIVTFVACVVLIGVRKIEYNLLEKFKK